MPVDHYENFPVASWIGPPALRPAIAAIYAFARGADDIADEGDAPAARRLAQLDHYEQMLGRIETADAPVETEPRFAALAAAVRRHHLPLAPFRDLLSAFRQDVVKTRYASYVELL
ncbi:MAG: squalene/phytoene synthase family protein, partial [Steroidobacterales bacterium]